MNPETIHSQVTAWTHSALAPGIKSLLSDKISDWVLSVVAFKCGSVVIASEYLDSEAEVSDPDFLKALERFREACAKNPKKVFSPLLSIDGNELSLTPTMLTVGQFDADQQLKEQFTAWFANVECANPFLKNPEFSTTEFQAVLNASLIYKNVSKANLWIVPFSIDEVEITPEMPIRAESSFTWFILTSLTPDAVKITEARNLVRKNLMCAYTRALGNNLAEIIDDLAKINIELEKAGQIARQAAERAARASILARNFSHVTGSHVISNPDFHLALAGEQVWKLWRNSLDSAIGDFESGFEYWDQQGVNLPGSVNPWRAGMMVLQRMRKSARISGGVLLEQTRRFHHYLQGRFDFIARAIDETHDRQEPVFFVTDLLDGFLSQTAFLSTLVADLGVRLPNIHFRVILPGETCGELTFQTNWNPERATETTDPDATPGFWKHTWEITGKSSATHRTENDCIYNHDVMLGLPGGMVSCQAFYALLENVIRNSIKYGSQRWKVIGSDGQPYVLTLHLAELESSEEDIAKRRLKLNISDNCSGVGKSGKTYADLKREIEKDILDESGRQQRHGLGIQEMILCADNVLTDRARRELQRRNESRALNAKEKALRLANKEPREGESWKESEPLQYEITLSKPVFLGIWIHDQNAKTHCEGTVRRTNCLGSILKGFDKPGSAGFSAQKLVIDGEIIKKEESIFQDGSRNFTLKELLQENQHRLPFRTFVVCKNAEQWDQWRKFLDRIDIHNRDSDRMGLSPARIRLITDSSLQEKLVIIDPSNATEAEKNILTLRCYDAWLKAWKGGAGEQKGAGGSNPSCHWDLWLGFQRLGIKDIWAPAVAGFKKLMAEALKVDHYDRVRFFVRGSNPVGQVEVVVQDATVEPDYWTNEMAVPIRDKRALVFDNHGECFEEALRAEKALDPRASTRYYQEFGAETPDLYRTLSHPPSDPFCFAYFIFSLIESCLANVAIFDERLAAEVLFEQGNDKVLADKLRVAKEIAAHHKAGVFPVLSFKRLPRNGANLGDDQSSRDPAIGMMSPRHHMAMSELFQKFPLSEEGIQFREDGSANCLPMTQDRTQSCSRCDVVMPDESGSFQLLRLSSFVDSDQFQQNGLTNDGNQPEPLPLDALIVHEGALDLISNMAGVDWKADMAPKLWKLAPLVVRTSGRGRATKHLHEALPFIEFNEVSSAVLTSRNKYSLVRGIFGTTGNGKHPSLSQ